MCLSQGLDLIFCWYESYHFVDFPFPCDIDLHWWSYISLFFSTSLKEHLSHILNKRKASTLWNYKHWRGTWVVFKRTCCFEGKCHGGSLFFSLVIHNVQWFLRSCEHLMLKKRYICNVFLFSDALGFFICSVQDLCILY